MATAAQPWTTKNLLDWTTGFFKRKGVDSPRLAAEMLLAYVLATTRLRLYMEPGRPASDAELTAFRELVQRAAAHEPVDYLIGSAPFFSLTLRVTPAVLIPRPSTEALVEHVLQDARRQDAPAEPTLADIGTGSGAMAVAIAKHWPSAQVVATDPSPGALKLARENAEAHGVAERIEFSQGSLLEPLADKLCDYLLSNPPYISEAEWAEVPPNVKDYEPGEALRAGADGLDYIRPLVQQAPHYLREGGQLVVEIAASQKQAVLELAAQRPGLIEPRVLEDHEALPRVLVARA